MDSIRKIDLLFNYITIAISMVVPKKKNRWVFGAWFGDRISDNPFALYNYIYKNIPDIEALWISNDVDDIKKLGLRGYKRNSFRGIWKCLTASVSIMNQSFADLGRYNWIYNSYTVQLWHGIPWKKIGKDCPDLKSGFIHRIRNRIIDNINRYDLFIAPSKKTRDVIKTAFLADNNSVLLVGQPRNEVLQNEEYCHNCRNKLFEILGSYNLVILYMPTFRDNNEEVFSFFSENEKLNPILSAFNAVILEKNHYIQDCRHGNNIMNVSRVKCATDFDSQFLLAAADILITDYSSCFFDFIIRNKPVLHFLYDYEQYKNDDRGLYYDIEEVVAGEVVYTYEQLMEALTEVLNGKDMFESRRKRIKSIFEPYESNNNSQIIYENIKKRTRGNKK